MPVLNIEGKRVRVDDSFLQLSPDEQNRTVDEIAGQMGIRAEAPESQASQDLRSELSGLSTNLDNPTGRQAQAEAARDNYYRSGIYGGENNPLGPIAKSIDAFASGAQRAPLLGWDDEVGAALNTAAGASGAYEKTRQQIEAEKLGQRNANPVASTLGELAGATTLATNAPSVAGRMVTAGQPLWKAAAASAADGMALGAAQGAGDAQPESRIENAGYGLIGGGALGALAPVAIAGVTGAARRAISPNLVNEERRLAADYLAGEGVGLTAGQRTGSDRLRYAESELGGRMTENFMDRQGEQYTAAALRRAGIDAPRATPEVMDDAFTRIGGDFDGLASRNKLMPDTQLEQELISTARDYVSLVPPSSRAPIVQDMLSDIAGALNRGPLDGATYQALRSRLDRAARSSHVDPQLQGALFGIRNALDNGMERSIAATNPNDAGAWREVRTQYRNMLTLEKAASAAGEDAAGGLISPRALRQATAGGRGRRSYVRGDGDFAELARSNDHTTRSQGSRSNLEARSLIVMAKFLYPLYAFTEIQGLAQLHFFTILLSP